MLVEEREGAVKRESHCGHLCFFPVLGQRRMKDEVSTEMCSEEISKGQCRNDDTIFATLDSGMTITINHRNCN